MATPDLTVERDLLAPYGPRGVLFAIDEVGRGCIAGEVRVGVAVVDCATLASSPPDGLRDSKLLTPRRRQVLIDPVSDWLIVVTGQATAAEIDSYGILRALRLAAERAMAELAARGLRPDIVLLDGNYDWLRGPEPVHGVVGVAPTDAPVVTRVKADRDCASVAAASVIAKVTRDRILGDLASHDGDRYGFAANAGYGTPAHRRAIALHGLGPQHRVTFCSRFPGPSSGE